VTANLPPETLFCVIDCLLKLGLREEAKERFSKFDHLLKNQVEGDFWMKIYKKAATALYLKSGTRGRDKYEAERLFRELIDLEDTFETHSLKLRGMFELIELLLVEFTHYKDEEVLNEIHELTDELLDIAERNNNHIQLIQATQLGYRLFIIEGEFTKAEELIKRALEICKQKGLETLAKTLEVDRMNMQDEISHMKILISKNQSLADRIEQSQVMSYFATATKIVNESD